MSNLSIRCGLGKTPRAEVRIHPRRSSASMSCSWLFLGGLVSTRAASASPTGRSMQYTRFVGRGFFSERQTVSYSPVSAEGSTSVVVLPKLHSFSMLLRVVILPTFRTFATLNNSPQSLDEKILFVCQHHFSLLPNNFTHFATPKTPMSASA